MSTNEQKILIQSKATEGDSIVLPNEDMKNFLLEVINQTQFPGRLVEFVANAKHLISMARIGN